MYGSRAGRLAPDATHQRMGTTGERMSNAAPSPSGLGAIPGTIWALGLMSLFMDASSELVHSLLPVFMVSALGASAVSVGLVEGIAEATAAFVKVFSGALSDRSGKRKLLTASGYALAALAKPLFPLAGSVGWVLAARSIDRIGKGIRGAPRDALIADVAPPHLRGASYGLRQSLDTVGALVGPLLAVVLMTAMANDIRAVLWVAVAPAAIAVVIVVFGVKERAAHGTWAWPGRRSVLPRCGESEAPFGGWSRSQRCSVSPASARPFWCCAPTTWGSPLRWCPSSWS